MKTLYFIFALVVFGTSYGLSMIPPPPGPAIDPVIITDPMPSFRPYQPMNLPKNCSENEWYDFDDGYDKVACECRPGTIHYNETDSCHAAYRQGPCSMNHYLVLDNEKVECIENPCKEDGMVSFNKTCYFLNDVISEKCNLTDILDVDKKTFQIELVQLNQQGPSVYPPLPPPPPMPVKTCKPGTRRFNLGRCIK